MQSSAGGWKACGTCKKSITHGGTYWVCSVSTCNGARFSPVFCSVGCWDAHVPVMNHRSAWCEERTAPAAKPAVDPFGGAPAAKPAPADGAKKSGGAFGALFRAVSKSIPESITKIQPPQEIDSDSNNSVTRRVHLKSVRITLSAYGKCLDLYKVDMNSYPDSGSGLRALIERPKALDPSMSWNGPYLSRGIVRDPWGKEYLYEGGIDAKEQQFYKIWSAGPNMQDENGKGDDIVQHSNQEP